ncbi:helix-turn-helix domain-containing protein [Bradyrhizobium sp. HKCCYLS20291]|uniref:helix-turn-helix domain-containing protein n=1 Tax=Bradyrhizobium sp. HKCCYLS20291 TaxID=3420766 RepID=UPI003EB6A70E
MSLRALTWAFDLVDADLTPTLKLVLITLANYANEKSETYPKQSTIAVKTCLTRQTVCAALTKLEDLDLISSTQRYYDNGGYRSKVYRLNVPAALEESINDDEPLSNSPTPGVSNPPTRDVSDDDRGCPPPRRPLSNTPTRGVGEDDNNNRVLEPKLEPKPEPRRKGRRTAEWPSDYREQFWAVVPRKIGKDAALTKLARIEREDKVEFDVIIAAMRRYANSPDVRRDLRDPDRRRFIVHPVTWLNHGRWSDEDGLPPESTDDRHRRVLARRTVAI